MRIDGFDLDNSPAAIPSERVAGKTVVLTTTNGTAALLRSQTADRVLVGLARQSPGRGPRAMARDERPAHLVCAGTDGTRHGRRSLAAGAIAAELEAAAAAVDRATTWPS